MLPSDFYLVARHEARFHVQVQLDEVAGVGQTPCRTPVEATVVRVFRDSGELNPGDKITFGVNVTRPGDRIPASGIIWTSIEKLQYARFLEVFLNGDPPKCELALSQFEYIDDPTDKPRMQNRYPKLARKHSNMRKKLR
jgi:hypothetical protein